MAEHKPFPKIPRLNRDVTVTEKIDGTNAAIGIIPDQNGAIDFYCQSRNRIITPDNDNYQFADWAYNNQEALIDLLGPGLHYGEWWGQGIQRNYGCSDRYFSLFNVHRWGWLESPTLDCDHDKLSLATNLRVSSVPVLGRLDSLADAEGLNKILDRLYTHGSRAASGYRNPEGVVLHHSASRQIFKVLLEDDHLPKSKVAA